MCDDGMWIEFIWLGKGTRTAQVESGNDLSGFQKRRQLNEELLSTEEKCLQQSLAVTFNNVYISSCNI
jgi:hypothetical protein